MRGLVVMLVAAAAWADPGPTPRFTTRDCARGQSRSSRGFPCDNYAFFELAPASGAGMGSACACANVTGAKGEAVTWARASSGACFPSGLNGAVSTGGQDCGNNLPRVVTAPNGQLSLLQEVGRTNPLLQNQAIDNAAWTATFTGAGTSTATVTANAANDPFGALTADRVQVSACSTASSSSEVTQAFTGSVATWAYGALIKGTSGSGSVRLVAYDTTAAAGTSIACSYNSTTWTWCGGPVAGGGSPGQLTRAFANATHQIRIGCVNYASVGGSDTGAADFLVWRPQAEAGTYPTSPILTVAAAAARVDDAFTAPAIPSVANNGSAAVWFAPQWTGATGPTAALIGGGTAGRYLYVSGSSGAGVRVFDGTNDLATGVSNHTAGQGRRFYSTWTGSTMTLTNVTDTNTVSGAFTGTMSTGALESGSTAWSGVSLGGLIYGICVDPSPSRCQ